MSETDKQNQLKDIPRMMRIVADNVAMGDYGQHVQAGLIIKDLDTDEVEVFGWGENSADIDTLLVEGREHIMSLDEDDGTGGGPQE